MRAEKQIKIRLLALYDLINESIIYNDVKTADIYRNESYILEWVLEIEKNDLLNGSTNEKN